jgi:lysine-specific demethylase 3
MYHGQYSVSGDFNISSTRLHMDITDAYNELLFAAKCPDGTPGCADWDLFRPEDAFFVRKFIREECGFQGPEDPIHSQSIYLTRELLERLFKKYGVRPITIRQYQGEIVFIPAYCAHQVRIRLYICSSLQLIRGQRLPTAQIVLRLLVTSCPWTI